MCTRLLRNLFVCSVATLLAGCPAAEEPPAVTSNEAAAAEPVPVEVFRPDSAREVLPSDRIYFTLTDHEWYAHGEPLLHEGRAYQPSGMPIAASVSEMTRAGEFESVEFYRHNNGEQTTVFVPVFPGYWQMFRADTSAAAAVVEPNR